MGRGYVKGAYNAIKATGLATVVARYQSCCKQQVHQYMYYMYMYVCIFSVK